MLLAYFLMQLLNATLCNKCAYYYSYLKTCKCNWSSAQTEQLVLCWFFSTTFKVVGDGIHSWGKDGHAGTETCARIDWSSTPAALWPGHVLVIISCVYHLVFTPVSFWILGKGRIKVLSFLILPIMSWTAERRQLCITSRAAECQGTMILWGTLGLWDPWGVLTPTAARRPMLPSAGTEAMAELQGGTGGAG